MQLSLQHLRQRINDLDARLVRLVNRRARLAGRIGHLKRKRGLPILDRDREAYVLKRISGFNPGPISERSLRRLFGGLIRDCRLLEEREISSENWKKNFGSPTISILGLGLIGASFALALKSRIRGCRVIGYDVKKPSMANLVDRFVTNPEQALKADIVILAMPVRSIIRFLERYGRDFRAGSLVMDMGSTKRRICSVAQAELPADVFFIGGHPLAGKAVAGARNADEDLFENKPFVLVPGGKGRLPAAKLKMARALVSSVGAIPIMMDAGTHDNVLAATSHLPNMVSVALALAAESLLNRRKPVSGPAFHEMTRLALSDYGVWSDIAATNKDFLLRALRTYQRAFSTLSRAIRSGQFRRDFDRARRFRQHLKTVSERQPSC